MPTSSQSGKASIKWIMSKIPAPKKALDIGCGEGTYAKMFPKLEWTGIEVWEPYVERYNLRSLYPELHVIDVDRWGTDQDYDVCFLGDVLEHMTLAKAVVLFNRAKCWAGTVIISIPIGHFPQGAWEGNPFERHVKDDWSDAEVKQVFGEPSWSIVDNEIGVYVYSKHQIIGNYEDEIKSFCLIPKVIHTVWVGDETKRPSDLIQTWVDQNPDWHVKVWGNKEFEERNWVNKDHMQAVWDKQLCGVADMMRYEILYEEGGFCVDADSICEAPLDDNLFTSNITLFYENEAVRPDLIANGYMASTPKNELFRRISETIKNDPSVPTSPAWIATGPTALTAAVRAQNPANTKIWPSHLFMPEHYSGQTYKGDDKVYGRQHWHTTMNKKKPKICVYAISKNEEQFVERFCKSAKDADYILIADTGSTDRTADLAYECGAVVHDIHVSPWRFDVARNAALALVPRDIDICVSLDLDEVLEPGWREEIEFAWGHETTRLHHLFDCGGGLVFRAERIHARDGYAWKHICHERATIDPRCVEVVSNSSKVLMTHYPDNSKSRGQYMPLLSAAVKDDPSCSRNAFYYARELLFHGRWIEAIAAFTKYLDNPTSLYFEERAYAMRGLGKCYKEINNLSQSEKWYYQASMESPNTREPWYELALLMYNQHRWEECFAFSTRGLKIKDKALVHTADASVWGYGLHDLAAISAHRLNLHEIAFEQGKIAIEKEPNDLRLQSNMEYYAAALKSGGKEA